MCKSAPQTLDSTLKRNRRPLFPWQLLICTLRAVVQTRRNLTTVFIDSLIFFFCGLLVAMVAALVVIPVTALVPGYSGFSAPLGFPLVAGAALFGLGMQLGNGCGSGTLYAAGGGSRRMWIVLPAFCAGGVIGTLILPAAVALPALPEVVLPDRLGAWGGLAATLLLGAGLIALVVGLSVPLFFAAWLLVGTALLGGGVSSRRSLTDGVYD